MKSAATSGSSSATTIIAISFSYARRRFTHRRRAAGGGRSEWPFPLPAAGSRGGRRPPAPVRFLPAFDDVVLGYHDRSRVIDDQHRGLSVGGARFVLVDGRVAATWTSDGGRVVVTPLRDLTRAERAERAEVAGEADRLTAFLSSGSASGVRS
ncbi:crosslink repair DNA glycosylase YcaQ family protein [Actinoplanes sp. NPDC049598]|uniref:DNA glycosylase AlkZ-like family protein n=1 Tax=Actinoplanes sp. NPDC049598 TaxID=3154626 RepID=UPI0034337C0D